MKIVAVDPGAVASGVAVMDGHVWFAKQFKDPQAAWAAIEHEFDEADGDVVFLIEDYRTGSHLTKEAKATIGLVKFFEQATWYYHAYKVTTVMRVEQHRLSGQREAAYLMGGTIDELKKDPERKDAFSALAHCCVYRRSL